MAQYVLFRNATTVFPNNGPIIPPATDGPIPPIVIAPQQSFQLTVTGTGAISAKAQVFVSNDRVHWLPYGDPVTVSGSTSATAGWGGQQNWEYYTSQLQALSGLNAQASCLMNG